MNNCREARRLATAAADGALDAGTRARLDGHLSSCEACRAWFSTERVVKACLARRQDAPVPADFAARVARRVAGEPSPFDIGWLGTANWRLWTEIAVPVAVGLFTVVLLTGNGTTTAGTAATNETGQAVESAVTATADTDTTTSSPWWRTDVSDEELVASMVGVSSTTAPGANGGSNGR